MSWTRSVLIEAAIVFVAAAAGYLFSWWILSGPKRQRDVAPPVEPCRAPVHVRCEVCDEIEAFRSRATVSVPGGKLSFVAVMPAHSCARTRPTN